LPLTLIAVLGLGLIARGRQPVSTLVSVTRATPTCTLAAPVPRPMPAWRLRITLDPELRTSLPEWVLFEGTSAGEGYELRWQPDRLAFQIARGIEAPFVLAATTLDHAPSAVTFARTGLRLSVHADGREVLRALDLMPPPAPSTVGFQSAAAIGDSMIALYDDSRLLEAPARALIDDGPDALAVAAQDRSRPDHAVVQARLALTLDADKAGVLVDAALDDAALATQALGPGHGDHAALAAWIAYGRLRLAQTRGDVERAGGALADLRPGARPPSDLLPGLMIQALAGLAQRATARPQQPAPVELIGRDRLAWMELTAQAAHVAIDASARAEVALSPTVQAQLRLIAHACECLAGALPQPTPAEAPPWLMSRWRAFAGRNPQVAEFPPVPLGWSERDSLGAVVDRLAQAAHFTPMAAVSARARVVDALERDMPDEARTAAADAPSREAALMHALLALAGHAPPGAALTALNAPLGDQPALSARDPLAYALARLLRRRAPRLKPAPDAPVEPAPVHLGEEVRTANDLPPGLKAYERLLGGAAEATHDIWIHDAAILPPAQALAAALAMQETLGTDVDWTQLAHLPCFTLPLGLLPPPQLPAQLPPR